MKLPEIMQRQRVEKWKAQILFFGTSAIYFFKKLYTDKIQNFNTIQILQKKKIKVK